jgi:diguanylate cyclase (GGDEF)-like protein
VGETRRDRRLRLSLGLAVGASLAFLVFLAVRPVGDGSVKLTANLAQLLAPSLAAVSCAWAAVSGSDGRTRRAWAQLAAAAACWAVGQATWVWYEHLARRDLPFPSLADVGYLGAIPLAVAAMLAFPGRADQPGPCRHQLRLPHPGGGLLDRGPVRRRLVRRLPAGGDAARRPASVGITWAGRRSGRLQLLLPYCPLALAVATSAFQQLRGQPAGPFLYWTFVALVLLIVGRQLLTVLDNQALNRRLAAMVGDLEHQAFHDGLTNLPNRALFRERVGHALRRRSQAGTPLALLFIDLDDFKTVNDQLGHAAGDDLLVAVAGRLQTCVRGEDTVARLGGDEFAILLEQAPSHEVAVRVAGRILESMGPPFPLQGHQVQVGASVGVTVSQAADVDAVLREADVAMCTAKARGKGRLRWPPPRPRRPDGRSGRRLA